MMNTPTTPQRIKSSARGLLNLDLYHSLETAEYQQQPQHPDDTSTFSLFTDSTNNENINATGNNTSYTGPVFGIFSDGDKQTAPEHILQGTRDSSWTTDDIVIIIVLPIILTVLLIFSMRHCFISTRRHADFLELRQNARAAHRAAMREERRVREKKRKDRLKDIDKALISKTASKCICNESSTRRKSIRDDVTMHTNITDDMSTSSSIHDIENPVIDEVSSTISGEYAEDTECAQTCAICLEPYVGGKDKVSWSRFQTCRHAFHHKCIEGWLAEAKNKNGNCPCCRGPYLKEPTEDSNAEEQMENGAIEAVLIQQTINEEGDVNEERPGNANVQTVVTEYNADVDRSSNTVGQMAGEDHLYEQSLYSETPQRTSDRVNNVDGDMPENATVQTPVEEEVNHTVGVATTSLAHEVTSSTSSCATKKSTIGSKFASFCIIHGLRKDEKKCSDGGTGSILTKTIDELTGAMDNVHV